MNWRNLELTQDTLQKGGEMIATSIHVVHEYKGGVRTEKVVGTKIDIVLPGNKYDTLSVLVAEIPNSLSAALEKGLSVKVEFTGFQARIYQIDGRVGITARADQVHIIEEGGTVDADAIII